MNFLPENLENYVANNTQKEPSVLEQLQRETWQKVLIPRMLSGHLQGRILSLISKMISPVNILEIGTYTGYSAICMAEGLADNGTLHTIDINEELKPIQDKYFELAGFRKKIIQHVGNALKIVPTLNHSWDLVFIDADKHNYINYYDLVFPQVKKGGILIFDNVLWSGKVIEDIDPNDKDSLTLNRLNNLLTADERIENVLFPVRDGLMVVRKK